MTNLPVPNPAQASPGNFITGALWNANVYNGLTFLLNPPVFVGTQATAQSIANTSWWTISLDSTIVDTYGGHSNTVNNSRYTVQVAGWYTIAGGFAMVPVNGSLRAVGVWINGSQALAGTGYAFGCDGNFEGWAALPTRDYYLNVGDYVQLVGWQGTGAAQNTSMNSGIRSVLYVRFSHA
ncbi:MULTISPECIES: hypothetical protein [unclassified Kitasatospora]|uniref:hypothetical protein n=1 Tax=unclassified Kitasatospora TaxID=2633591 RepID=UPI00247513CC|nr:MULTISPECIES: hypothetical protein [unclassified Kitasatospora]MDH6123856.1 hypothetical protein [Kitasatospora sp. GP82]MDH6576045.1 hypothetical protein [Kitasatospora sp. MAP5-34]